MEGIMIHLRYMSARQICTGHRHLWLLGFHVVQMRQNHLDLTVGIRMVQVFLDASKRVAGDLT